MIRTETFCDLVVIDHGGRDHVHKSPSTPHDNAQGVFNVLGVAEQALGAGPGGFHRGMRAFAQGTTIATNAVVTRTGAKVGLITTMGHADMISIMRVNGRVAGLSFFEILSYATSSKPKPIVPKGLIAEANERLDFTGDVIVPLQETDVIAAVDRLMAQRVESIAVSLM